jgi:hypothetical protein
VDRFLLVLGRVVKARNRGREVGGGWERSVIVEEVTAGMVLASVFLFFHFHCCMRL